MQITIDSVIMYVQLDERIKSDKASRFTGYYTYIKYYELLRELYFKCEEIVTGKNEQKARLAHNAIESVLAEFDADTKKYGHSPKRKLDRKYLAKRCKEFERLINARVK